MPANNETRTQLSDTQRALLQRAVRHDYFKVPRGISTVELAEETDMSSREASEEMSRAVDIVLRDADLGE